MRFSIIISSLFSFLSTASPTDNQGLDIRTTAEAAAPNAGCYWSGTAPFCAGHCPSPYTECKQEKKNCWTGHKSHCCNPRSTC
ncbi:hypothetical protein G6O67_006653 [Ophiocordyceps sinensis]|uniref:Uncharacterized protein n=1 Tax=Ophiocordyceps sinensis TaxID=72228 RepID=A0A8H4LVZ2_9HYPO|nr:hypothetical protein G6O67_006653 [Ophiocordyceps sinensis]